MAKFNISSAMGEKTENLAGGEAFKESAKLVLLSILLTSFVKDQYYRSEDETIKQIIELMNQIADKKFLAKAAIFTRIRFGMRSMPHIAAAELARMVKGEQWTKNFFDKIVYRPDDMMEILAYYLAAYGKSNDRGKKRSIPNAMKKGFAMAFNRFDEYALAKYRSEGKNISLIDIVNLIHPIPVKENAAALEKLVAGVLVSKDTWESELTKAGQKANTEEEKALLKKETWKNLILEKKIGYFALLRNLRNIVEQAPGIVNEACELLTNEALIKKSLVLPFRFLTAIEQINQLQGADSRKVIIALNKVIDISTSNTPVFDGDTLVALDASGSMSGKPYEIGVLFAAVLAKSNNSDIMIFSETAEYINYNPDDSTLSISKNIKNEYKGGGTNFHSIFQTANRHYKRIIILSDMQGWMGQDAPIKSFAEYKSIYGKDTLIYSFDLAGYGTLQFPERGVFCLAGFSEKVFDIMKLLEQDKEALINEIEKIEL